MTHTDSTDSDDALLPAPLRAALPYFLLALAVFAAYCNIFDNQFLFDDDLLIQGNTYLRGWTHIPDILTGSTTSGIHIAGGFFRPAQIFLYLLAFHADDGGALGFHALNLGLHIANTCLVYRMGTRMGFAPTGVFAAALLWGLHPLHTEAVTYMSATADPLFAFFCLLSLDLLIPSVTPKRIAAIMPLFLLGLMSKETMVVLPLLVMACLFFLRADRRDLRLYFRTGPLWLIALGFALWRATAPGFDGPQTYARFYALPEFANLKMYAENPLSRLYTFWATLPAYADLLIWPHDLHMERSFAIFTDATAPPVIEGFLICLAACAAIVRAARTPTPANLPLAWGILWFFAAHAPDSGILIPMNSLFLEHWMYLPSAGLFLGLAEAAARTLKRAPQPAASGLFVLSLLFSGAMAAKTYAQNEIWRTPESFYLNIFAHGERSARARNNLALYYSDSGNYAAAIDQFKQAIALSDTYAETRHNLALTYLRLPGQPHYAEAFVNLRRALELDPRFYRSWETLAALYALTGDKEKAADARAHLQALMPPGP